MGNMFLPSYHQKSSCGLKLRYLIFVLILTNTLGFSQKYPIQWQSRGIGGGGAVYAPSINPSNSSEMYITCDMTQVFHTTSAGASWNTVPYHQLQPVVESSVQFTSNNSIRYALRYLFIQGTSSIVKSNDGGNTWSPINAPNGVVAYHQIYASPLSDSVLVVSDKNNIYFSSNGGNSYVNIYNDPASKGLHLAGAFFDGQSVFICTNKGMMVSTNGGVNFAAPFSTGMNLITEEIVSFAGAKQGSTYRFVCVTLAQSQVRAGVRPGATNTAALSNIYGLTFGAASWTAHTNGLEFPNSDKVFQVAMARNDTSTVYLGGYCKVMLSTAHTVFKSINGGRNYSNVFIRSEFSNPVDSTNAFNNNFIMTGWWGNSNINNFPSGWTTGSYSTGMTADPSDASRVIIMNNSAVHLSTNGGATWKQVYLDSVYTNPLGTTTISGSKKYKTNGFENTASWWMTWQDSLTLYSGLNDILATKSVDGGVTWSYDYTGLKWPSNPSGGKHKDAAQIIKHPQTGVLYAAAGFTLGQAGKYTDNMVDPLTGAVMYSADSGKTWLTLKNFEHMVTWITLDPFDLNRMYACVANSASTGYPGGIYRCNNITLGLNAVWDTLGIPVRAQGRPNFVSVLKDSTLICAYAARDVGSGVYSNSSGIFYSTNNGQSWIDRTGTGMGYSVSAVTIDPNDVSDSTWFVCVHPVGNVNAQQGLYKTTNRGLTWINLNSNYQAVSCSFHPVYPNEMYFCTNRTGVFYVTNTNTPSPVFTHLPEYPFGYPQRVFFNPYNHAEVWITSVGGGNRVGYSATPGFGVTGNVFYDNSTSSPLAGTDVFLIQGVDTIMTTTTDLSGNFSFSYVPNGIYTLSAKTNKPWAGVNSTDALLVRRHFSFVALLSGFRLMSADVNNSTVVNSTDALLIQRRFSFLISSFVAGDWIFESHPITVNFTDQIVNLKGLCFGDVNGSNSNP